MLGAKETDHRMEFGMRLVALSIDESASLPRRPNRKLSFADIQVLLAPDIFAHHRLKTPDDYDKHETVILLADCPAA